MSLASFGIAGLVAMIWLNGESRPLSRPNPIEPAPESRPTEGVQRPSPQAPDSGPRRRWT